jgi:hypothetical protein
VLCFLLPTHHKLVLSASHWHNSFGRQDNKDPIDETTMRTGENINDVTMTFQLQEQYISGSGYTGAVRPLLVSHPFRRVPKYRRSGQGQRQQVQEQLERREVSLRYVTSIVTTINRIGRRRHHLRVVQDDESQDANNNNAVHDNINGNGDDDDDSENEVWTPIIPFVVVLSRRYANRIGQCLRQLPDMMFLFWCLCVICFVFARAPPHFTTVQSCRTPPTLQELQLRRELGLMKPTPAPAMLPLVTSTTIPTSLTTINSHNCHQQRYIIE